MSTHRLLVFTYLGLFIIAYILLNHALYPPKSSLVQYMSVSTPLPLSPTAILQPTQPPEITDILVRNNYALVNRHSVFLPAILDKTTGKYVIENLPLRSDLVRDFHYDTATGSLYIVANSGPNDWDTYEDVFRLKTTGPGKFTKDLLAFYRPGLYSGTRILELYPSGTLLLQTSGGDGCGGRGNLWKIASNTIIDIQEYGVGCALPELPRYLGFYRNRLYFQVLDTTRPVKLHSTDDDSYAVNQVYFIDPITFSKTVIFNHTLLPNDAYVAGGEISDEHNWIEINMVGDPVPYYIDLTTHRLRQTDSN